VIEVDIDERAASRIDAVIDSPLRDNVEFLYRRPGDDRWSTFYASKVGEDVASQSVRTMLDPLPVGTQLLFTFVFSGARKTAFRLCVTFAQDDRAVGAPIELTGSTGDQMAVYREVEVRIA
jgi:hypothetical protein